MEETDFRRPGALVCAPGIELRPIVTAITARRGPAERLRRFVADGASAIIFRSASSPAHAEIFAAGPRSAVMQKRLDRPDEAVTVSFRPGWGCILLNAPLCDLRDRYIDLAELWGDAGRELRDQLTEARSIAGKAEILKGAVHRRLAAADERRVVKVRRVIAAAANLGADGDLPDVRTLASALGVGPRQARRCFAEVIGLSPMTFLQIARYRHAQRLADQTKTPDWAQISQEAGYFDQSHMIGAFRRFAGVPPATAHSASRERDLRKT